MKKWKGEGWGGSEVAGGHVSWQVPVVWQTAGHDCGWGRGLSSSSGSGEDGGPEWQGCRPHASLFSLRNTMYNIRGNKQSQGTGHRPPGEDSPLIGEPQREEQPSPPDPSAPGEPLPRSERPFGDWVSALLLPEHQYLCFCVSTMQLSRSLLLGF